MITLTLIISIVVLIILTLLTIVAGIGAGVIGILLPFLDIIIAVWIIVGIVKLFRRKKSE